LNIGLKSCNTGTNGPEKEPEYISLTVPGTRGNNNVLPPQPPSPQLPGFLRIGPNCALALVHPELLQYSFLCGQRGGN
jgi:hypothetical protein